MIDPLRFYTHNGEGDWKQCHYCKAYVQLRLNGLSTNKVIEHQRPCPVAELEEVAALLRAPVEQPWQPMETIPDRPVLVCWSAEGPSRVEMVGGRREYLEVVGYGEPIALGWMSLPDPHGALVRAIPPQVEAEEQDTKDDPRV